MTVAKKAHWLRMLNVKVMKKIFEPHDLTTIHRSIFGFGRGARNSTLIFGFPRKWTRTQSSKISGGRTTSIWAASPI